MEKHEIVEGILLGQREALLRFFDNWSELQKANLMVCAEAKDTKSMWLLDKMSGITDQLCREWNKPLYGTPYPEALSEKREE